MRLQIRSLRLPSLLLRLLPLLLPLLLSEHQSLVLLLVLPCLSQSMPLQPIPLQLPLLRLSRLETLLALLPKPLEQRS
jgi:hypothetical protein